jgi:hypothetical protein
MRIILRNVTRTWTWNVDVVVNVVVVAGVFVNAEAAKKEPRLTRIVQGHAHDHDHVYDYVQVLRHPAIESSGW